MHRVAIETTILVLVAVTEVTTMRSKAIISTQVLVYMLQKNVSVLIFPANTTKQQVASTATMNEKVLTVLTATEMSVILLVPMSMVVMTTLRRTVFLFGRDWKAIALASMTIEIQ